MSLIERAIHRMQPARPATGPTAAGDPLIGRAREVAGAVATGAGLPPGHTPRDDGFSDTLTTPRPGPAVAPTAEAPPSRRPAAKLSLKTLGARGFSIPGVNNSRHGDAFRMIKRPLLDCAGGRGAVKVDHARRIMITSALPGEGKTFTAINLAMSIAAERDHSVMLIDADVVRPSVMKTLGVDTERGLMDWLRGDIANVHELVMSTNLRRLSLLPAGTPHGLATEMLASASMERLLDTLSLAFPNRILLFDAPPLLAATEAQALAAHMGQVVLVVEAGRTPRASVHEALGLLRPEQFVNIVLNKARRPDRYVDQAYGYARGGQA